ncbi:phosphoribosylformylglycinamidine cyclo-ligase [Candidatus Gottesmanbacteria bacterium]|nr:phosphoribosylformylglycinamidine cyclo-ligase [Candidatus Gottesmanbacteria bacterium]
MKKNKITYKSSGVNYSVIDPLKIIAQKQAQVTARKFQEPFLTPYEKSRGESAYLMEYKDCYIATVIECLGTKNLIAEEMRKITGKTYYDSIAQDAVAMIVNDLITTGAQPFVVNAYWSVGNSDWFSDSDRMKDLTKGWADACMKSGAVWGGGETPTLSGINMENTINLAGSGVGIIKPKQKLVDADNLQENDAIILLESSGVHANGISLTRKLAKKLKKGYKTKLPSNRMYGEALLTPTTLYVECIKKLLEMVKIHYLVNITGHGFKKLMRAKPKFSYIITSLSKTPEVFTFIQNNSGLLDKEMYETFNMGAGFAVYVSKNDVKKVITIAKSCKIRAWEAGFIKSGKKQVEIKPRNIIFESDSLKVRL